MIEPKTFYRELDAILGMIDTDHPNAAMFKTILKELEERFGASLRFERSHAYGIQGRHFSLLYSTKGGKQGRPSRRLPKDSEFVRLILKHKSYIFDEPEVAFTFKELDEVDTLPTAISVYNPYDQWLLVFEFDREQSREEISLFLNAVRTAVNYRLFSKSIRNELERAVQIQKSLLPRRNLDAPGYEIVGQSRPAKLVGGDFFDHYLFDSDTFSFSLGDASGHGLPAALLVRDVVIGLRMGLARDMKLVYTLKKLNQVIQRSTYSTNFVSLFVGEMEADGHLFYVNAGHHAPFVIDDQSIHDLPATGITLGFLPDIPLYRSYVHMKPGAILVLYTDGIIERANARDEQYGIERLKAYVKESRDLNAEELIEGIFDDANNFGNRSSWEDDATLLVVKRSSKDQRV
jgi:sigma-B regulation protein RsbU (phosphoserine phosphatase)